MYTEIGYITPALRPKISIPSLTFVNSACFCSDESDIASKRNRASEDDTYDIKHVSLVITFNLEFNVWR